MIKLTFGMVMLAIVVLFRILPFFITYCFVAPHKKVFFSIIANVVFIFLVRYFFLGDINIYISLRDVIFTNYTYQQMLYLPMSSLICFIFSVALGLILRKAYKIKVSHLNKNRILFATAVFLIGIVINIYISLNGVTSIQITEIQAFKEIRWDRKDYNAYVEVYNPGLFPCDLNTMYITDSDKLLKKINVENGIIPEKSYSIIPFNTNAISLSSKQGQTLILSNMDGRIIDTKTTFQTRYGQASGLIEGEKWDVVVASPNEKNVLYESEVDSNIDKPIFSAKTGFYAEPFELTISATNGFKVYYTTDGSEPNEKSNLYDGPIHIYDKTSEPCLFRSCNRIVKEYGDSKEDFSDISKAYVIRAASFDSSGKRSDITTATYWIDSKYEGQAVLSIVADPDDLYGDDGIYVTGSEYDEWYLNGQYGEEPTPNFNKSGRGYEIPAHFDYVLGNNCTGQDVGLRIQGGSSRNFAIKSLGLYARSDYDGNNYFTSDFFGVKARKVRTKGGFANTIVQNLAKDRNVSTQHMLRTNVFVNGEFLCNTNIIEKYDETYFENYYGIDDNNIMIFSGFSLEENADDAENEFRKFLEYVRTTNFSDDNEYDRLSSIMNIQSYLDSLCIRTYINDMDFTDDKNMVVWRSVLPQNTVYGDCCWRWALNDLDGMEWGSSNVSDNTYTAQSEFNGGRTVGTQYIYSALKANNRFRESYANTFMDLTNSIFKYANVEKVIREYGDDLTDYQGGNGGTQSIDFYYDFFRNRAEYIVPYMAEELELKGTLESVKLQINDPAAGIVRLNTITVNDFLDEENSFCGQYYTDYAISLEAIPNKGYKFVGWTGDLASDDNVEQIKLKVGGTEINAVFEKE